MVTFYWFCMIGRGGPWTWTWAWTWTWRKMFPEQFPCQTQLKNKKNADKNICCFLAFLVGIPYAFRKNENVFQQATIPQKTPRKISFRHVHVHVGARGHEENNISAIVVFPMGNHTFVWKSFKHKWTDSLELISKSCRSNVTLQFYNFTAIIQIIDAN